MYFYPSFNNTGALVAAAALLELFPGIHLLERTPSAFGFSLHFYSSYPIPAEAEKLLEEKMRQIVREKRDIRTFEMVASNAKEFLKSKGFTFREIEGKNLVEVVQMGNFVDLSMGSLLENSKEVSAFKLFPLLEEEKVFILNGISLPSKEELTAFLKKWKNYKGISHITKGLVRKYWKEVVGEMVWLKAGLDALMEFSLTVKKPLFEGCVEVFFPNRERIIECKKNFKSQVLAEIYRESFTEWDEEIGFFASDGHMIELSSLGKFEEWGDNFISSLQRIGKTLNILGFECILLFEGFSGKLEAPEKRIETLLKTFEKEGVLLLREELKTNCLHFLVEDAIGRRWPAFTARWDKNGFSIIGTLERLFALALEKEV